MLMFSAPSFLASIIISVVLFGAVTGVLWLFVLGDNPWPSSANNMLMVMLILSCIALWVAFISVAYMAGKKQETRAAINAKHVVMSVSATATLLLLIVSHQWSVGNIGTKSDSVLCSEYCRDQGFAGSGMPPRNTGVETCSCLDAQGREATKVPIEQVIVERRK